jgi:glucose-6-phosphate isomerase
MDKNTIDKYRDCKFIFVVGIGGSDLASKAVWNAMTLHKPDVEKKIFFLESPEAREYEEIKSLAESEILNPNEFVLIAISKSGKTAETLETFNKTFHILSEKFGDLTAERTIIISTKDTTLWKIGEEKKIECLEWEGDVGGRFSAFTLVHTTVLAIAGLDAEAFVAGSEEMKKKCGEENAENPAKHLAKNIFDNYKNGANILDFFIFNSELEDLGKWCRQLVAESLSTITPTVSVGPTDLHSMLELYLGGPKDRFTIFIKSTREINGSINDTAYEDVAAAYGKAGLPFIKYEMEKINEKELGNFMQYMIAATLELAKLLGVDPYDQPAVEKYKSEIQNQK